MLTNYTHHKHDIITSSLELYHGYNTKARKTVYSL